MAVADAKTKTLEEIGETMENDFWTALVSGPPSGV